MNASVDLTWLFGIVISLLLSLVVYFVRLLHLVMGVVRAALLASPVALPAMITMLGGYLTLGGSIISAISQTAVKGE